MNAIIYICHGSRVSAAREQAVHFINKFMNHSLAPIQEYCFLEFAAPTIAAAFINAVNQGAKRIVVIPVLLLSAAHAKNDIPNELSRLGKQFPDIEIIYGDPIGVHPKMAIPLMERIAETGADLTDNSMVLLVGRGSSDPDVKRDLNRTAEMLKTVTRIKHVESCFLTASLPSLDEGLRETGEGNYDKVFVIPYLLFTGILMNRINRTIETHSYRSKFYLCNNLGYHPSIDCILQEKINTLLAR